MTHTTPDKQSSYDQCPCEPIRSIPFLDTLCTIKAGNIETDLYRKPTDKNQYLLTSSCHPLECLESIPFSLLMRINWVLSEETDRDRRFKELKEMLLDREYSFPWYSRRSHSQGQGHPLAKGTSESVQARHHQWTCICGLFWSLTAFDTKTDKENSCSIFNRSAKIRRFSRR